MTNPTHHHPRALGVAFAALWTVVAAAWDAGVAHVVEFAGGAIVFVGLAVAVTRRAARTDLVNTFPSTRPWLVSGTAIAGCGAYGHQLAGRPVVTVVAGAIAITTVTVVVRTIGRPDPVQRSVRNHTRSVAAWRNSIQAQPSAALKPARSR